MVSRDVQRDLKYLYSWNHYTMRFMGIWPEERRWKQPLSYLVLPPILTMLCFVCLPQTVNLPIVWNDLYLVVDNLSLANVTITISMLKAIIFWVNGKPLKSLLRCMAVDWSREVKPSERETMRITARTTRTTIITSTMLCILVIVMYIFLRYMTMKHKDTNLFFRGYFPYNVDVSPNYELTIFGQLTATVSAGLSYAAVDTFIAMLIFHVCGQLSILRQRIRDLHLYDKAELRVKLAEIVRKHEYLNRFAAMIEKCFNMLLLLQMLGCTLQLCFQCFQVIMSIQGNRSEFLIFQISFLAFYVIYVMLQLYLYCYVGERLSVESTEVAMAVYECEWYNLSPRDAQSLILIIQRARLPLQITAGRFCSFTLVLYSQILKTSMGYISVLYATKIQ